jgi:hypothetical protein
VLTDYLGGDEDIVLGCGVGALSLTKEAKSFPGDLDHALGVCGLGRRSILDGCLGSIGRSWIVEFIGTRAVLVTTLLITSAIVAAVAERTTAALKAASTPAIVAATALTALLGGVFLRRGSLGSSPLGGSRGLRIG